jgi:hypothetical protein
MAKECFCGCGRPIPRIPIGLRSMNTRGRLVSDRLAWFEVVTGVLQWSPEDDDRILQIDALRWGFVLLSAFDDYAERLRELEDEYPDARPEPGA